MSHRNANTHCRLDIDVQLVTSHKGGFDDVRVRASLFQLDEAHPNGCLEVLTAVEVEVKDKDHWISLDANTKCSHAEAGTGGLALVRTSRHGCWTHHSSPSRRTSVLMVGHVLTCRQQA